MAFLQRFTAIQSHNQRRNAFVDERQRSPGPNGSATTTQFIVEGSACIDWFVALYRSLVATPRKIIPVVHQWCRPSAMGPEIATQTLGPPRIL